ncbi:hypothetical protein ALC56_13716 [Trachymyrmex septentrionalis]|uniref:Uncharacterized protein n=1 Tax=Trachymyrmex septentrionalis TaxID=34720 RepID=A0A195EUN9_9HYME|nr:hypothetical protein ALC56_13716 [Trachymyrmex septentrionalis]
MAAKDYEGTATAAVSNFQRYYYFNPLSLRQGAASQQRYKISLPVIDFIRVTTKSIVKAERKRGRPPRSESRGWE